MISLRGLAIALLVACIVGAGGGPPAAGVPHLSSDGPVPHVPTADCSSETPYEALPSAPAPVTEPYCGIQSLYSAATSIGRPFSFRQILVPEFVSRHGSTADQLTNAALRVGLHTTVLHQLTCASVAWAPCPVILHTKARYEDNKFDHWMLCLGADERSALIVDGDKAPERIPLTELRALWDGTGVFVSSEPISVWSLQAMPILQCTFWLLLGCLVCGAVKSLKPIRRPWAFRSPTIRTIWSGVVAETIVLLGLSAGLALAGPSVLGGGSLDSEKGVKGIIDENLPNFLSTVTTTEMLTLRTDPSATIIDARWLRDYTAGHIGGAINIQPNSSIKDCVAQLSLVPHERSIMVYCQSRECPYAAIVARKLVQLGYTKVRLYRDGYAAWLKSTNT
jgi:rhodanese-related sulfurtransferase